MAKKYIVTLSKDVRCELQTLVSTGKSAARKLIHARILLLADAAEGDAPINKSRMLLESVSAPWNGFASDSWKKDSPPL